MSVVAATCPSCGYRSERVPAQLVGRDVTCPRCKARFRVESSSAPEPLGSDASPAATTPELPQPTTPESPPGTTPEAPLATTPEGLLATTPESPAAPRVAAAPGPADGWRVGEVVLGLYEITGVLGQGGMGRVYKARHRGWDLDLAVKSPLPQLLEVSGGAEAFEAEAETWVHLGLHPHVVPCYYVRRVDGIPRVFAEFVDGGSLHDWIRTGRLRTLDAILDVAIQFAWGLDYAHEQGLVHRDVKPGNVMIASDGTAKVTDFGLARAGALGPVAGAAADTGSTLLVKGGGAGTPAYMAPEQVSGADLTRRSDLWAFALSVIEMFNGSRHWEYGVQAAEALDALLANGPARAELPRLPETVADLLRACFHEDPDQRPHDLAAAATVLRAAYEQELGRKYPRPEPRAGSGRADSLNNSAVSLLDLERLDEAITLWDRALDAEPQHLEATYNRAVFEWTRGRLDDGELERRLAEARRSHPREARAHALTARVLQGLGDRERAAAAQAEAASAGLEGDDDTSPADVTATFRGLPGLAQALAVTPDGRLAIAGGGGREARVWDLASGALVRKLTADDGKLRSLALSVDGRLLLWGAEGAPLRALDLALGKPARAFQLVAGTPLALAPLVDGRHFVAAMSDRTLRVFDLGTGQCVRTLEGHEDAVVAVAAGPTRIVSGSRDGSVRVWDAATGALVAVLRGASGRVNAVALDEARGRIAAGGDDHTVSLWPRLEATTPLVLRGPTQAVSALAFDPRGDFLVVGSLDRSLRFFSLLPTALHTVLRLDAAVQALVVRDDLVLAAHGGLVSRVVTPRQPRWPALALCRPASAAEMAARQAEFETCVSEARDRLVEGELAAAFDAAVAARAVPGFERAESALRVWDELAMRLPGTGLRAAWEERAFTGHTDAVLAVAASAAGDFASAGTDRSLRVVDPDGSTRALGVHDGPVAALAFTLEGQKLLSAGWDQVLRIWDVADGHPLATLQGHTGYVVALALSHDGRRVATGSLDHTVRLWRLDGRLERTLVGHEAAVASVAWSPDGRVVASAGWDETVRLWDAENGNTLGVLIGHRGNVNAVAVSPAGVALASGGADGTVRLWDPRERKELRTLAGHVGEVTALTFSADGNHLVSAGRDGTARVWNLASGACVRVLAHPAPVLALALVPLQQRLLTGGIDRQLRVWHLDWELDRPEDPIRLKPQTVRIDAVEAAPTGGSATGAALSLDRTTPPAATRPGSTAAVSRATATPAARHPASSTPTVRPAAAGVPAAPVEWADVRKAAPRTLLRPPAAPRTWPWRRLAIGGGLLVAVIVSLLVWLGPSRKLRFVQRVLGQARAEVDLIDTATFRDNCDGDYAATLGRAASANASAPDIACLADFADPGVVADYLAAAPRFGEDGRDTERLRRNALSLLVGLGEPGTPGLCDALADERDEVRGLVARALALQPTPGARDCLTRAIRGGGPEVRAAAVRELPRLFARGDLALEPGFALVAELLAVPEPTVRAAAVSTLPVFDVHHARPLAEAAQGDADAAVREAAVAALRQILAARIEEERDGVR